MKQLRLVQGKETKRMQASQKLWDLGEHEDTILDYLAAYYAPVEQGDAQLW